VMVWVIHITYDDQAKGFMLYQVAWWRCRQHLSCEYHSWVNLDKAQGKGMKHRLFHFTGYEECREVDSRI
jgi:hypothetical protein